MNNYVTNAIGQSYVSRFYDYFEDRELQIVTSKLDRIRDQITAFLDEKLFDVTLMEDEPCYDEIKVGGKVFGNHYSCSEWKTEDYTFSTIGITQTSPEMFDIKHASRYFLDEQKFFAISAPLKILLVTCSVANYALRILSIPLMLYVCISTSILKIGISEFKSALTIGAIVWGWGLGPVVKKIIEYASLHIFRNVCIVADATQQIENVNALIMELGQCEMKLLGIVPQSQASQESVEDLLKKRNNLLVNCKDSLEKISSSIIKMDGWAWRLQRKFS